MNSINPTIKNTFTYSKQTITFLDVQMYLSENKKLKTKLYRKSTECMTLLHFPSQHPLSCKEGIIYSQALRYNMIISDDHILQAEFNNLTRILLAQSYPLHLTIKNIKKALSRSRNYLLSQPTPHTETNILPIITPFSDIGKQPSGHPNLCKPTPNPTVFIATLSTQHKHMVPLSKTPRTTTHTHPYSLIRTYPHITTVVRPIFSSIPDTPNSS